MQLDSVAIQKYVRIGLQWLASYLVTAGLIDPNSTWIQPTIGAAVGLASFLWTLYGDRINARMAGVEAITGTHILVDTDKAPSEAVAVAEDKSREKVTPIQRAA